MNRSSSIEIWNNLSAYYRFDIESITSDISNVGKKGNDFITRLLAWL